MRTPNRPDAHPEHGELSCGGPQQPGRESPQCSRTTGKHIDSVSEREAILCIGRPQSLSDGGIDLETKNVNFGK